MSNGGGSGEETVAEDMPILSGIQGFAMESLPHHYGNEMRQLLLAQRPSPLPRRCMEIIFEFLLEVIGALMMVACRSYKP